MKIKSGWSWNLCIALFFLVGHANAADFDRSAEIKKYMDIVTNGSKAEMSLAAKHIYFSGLSDPALAAAVNARILRDYADLEQPDDPGGAAGVIVRATTNSVDEIYGVWLVRALASFGLDQYSDTFQKVYQRPGKGGTEVKKMRQAAKQESKQIDWYKQKNEIMADAPQMDGVDPYICMIIGLLGNDDPAYQRFALKAIKFESVSNQNVLTAVSQQVSKYAEQTADARNRRKDNVIALYIRMLGKSGDRQYRDVMQRVLSSPTAAPGVKKWAQISLDELQ